MQQWPFESEFAIVYPDEQYASGWTFLYGHGCSSKIEMERYCSALDPKGTTFKVVTLPFDINDANNPFGRPVKEEPKPQSSIEDRINNSGSESLKQLYATMQAVLKRNPK